MTPFRTRYQPTMAFLLSSLTTIQAIVGWYRVLNGVNLPYGRLRLQGLSEDLPYRVNGESGIHYGSELMNAGLITTDASSGQAQGNEKMCRDFESRLYILKAD